MWLVARNIKITETYTYFQQPINFVLLYKISHMHRTSAIQQLSSIMNTKKKLNRQYFPFCSLRMWIFTFYHWPLKRHFSERLRMAFIKFGLSWRWCLFCPIWPSSYIAKWLPLTPPGGHKKCDLGFEKQLSSLLFNLLLIVLSLNHWPPMIKQVFYPSETIISWFLIWIFIFGYDILIKKSLWDILDGYSAN